MKSATLTTEPQASYHVILIVDKVGIIGEALAKEFAKDYLVVILSAAEIKKEKNIIPIKFKKKIPLVPQAKYKKIFLIDDGGSVTRESAFSFIKLARQHDAPLFFIGSLRNTDIDHADSIAAEYANSKVLIFGDIFDKKVFFDKDASVSRYIIEARKLGKIEVPGSGLSLSFPVSFEDTIKLIIKATTLNIIQKVILLFYPHPITDISLANVFQKVDPDLKIDFGKEKKERRIYYPKNAVHAISKYDLEKKIKELDLQEKEDREVKVINKDRRVKNRIFRPVLFFLLACLFLALLPFFSTVAYTKLGEWEIRSAVKSSGKGDFEKAIKQANNSKTFFSFAEKTSEPLIAEAEVIGLKREAEKIHDSVGNGQDLADATISMLEGFETLQKVYKGSSANPKEDFQIASNNFKSALATTSKLNAEGNLPKEYRDKLENLEPFTDLFINSSDILPEILGFDGEKNYLVILFDNASARPGGGEINSFVDLKVKNAKITQFKVLTPAEVDQKIKQDTFPPFEYRRFMGEKNILIKDSLNSPDFVKSAISASGMYGKSSGSEVDGVIGVDSDFLKSLLELSGGVMVDSKTIGAENFEAGNREGYFGEVADGIKTNIDSNENRSMTKTAEEIGRLIKEKHIIFAMQNPSLQNVFTANGWSSAIWDNRGEEQINDYLAISETNVGKNKVNTSISRSVVKKVSFNPSGKIKSSVSVSYKNSSSELNYSNYMKIVLPAGSQITSILIDKKQFEISQMQTDFRVYESINFKKPVGLEVDSGEVLGKNYYGMFINIPKSSSKNILINYDLPYSFNTTNKSAIYSLKLFKQPGTEYLPFNLNFSLPDGYQIVGKGAYAGQIKSDIELKYIISQK